MVVAVEGIVRNGRGDVLLTSLVSSGSSETVARVGRASGAVSGLLLYLLLSNSSNGSGVVTGEVAVGIGSVVIAGIFVAIARVSLEGGSGSGKVGGRGVPRRVIAILEKVLLGSFLILFGSEDASDQGDQNQKAL